MPELQYRKSEEVVSQIMQSMDHDKNGVLNFSEFLTGTLEPTEHLNEKNLTILFGYLDPYHRGKLTMRSLMKAFSKVGKHFSEDQLCAMFSEIGLESD